MFTLKTFQMVLGGLIGLSLMGCTNTLLPSDIAVQANQLAQDSSSNLYIYRPFTFQNATYQPVVMVNGERVARLKAGGYVQVSLSEGDNTMTLHHMKNPFEVTEAPFYQATINSQSGQAYYFRWGDHNDFGLGNVLVQSEFDVGFVSATVGETALTNKNLVALN